MSNPNTEARLARAMARHRAGDLAAAEAGYREVLAATADHAGALGALGVLLRATGRTDAAVETLARAVALAPDDPALHNNLGNALGAAGRWTEAVAAYHRAVALLPDYAEAHANLGRALTAAGDAAGAVDHLDRAHTLAPALPGSAAALAAALNDRGNDLFQAGDLAAARDAYGRALDLDPGLLPAANNLGSTRRALGDLDGALAAYDAALDHDPDHAEVRWNRALTLLLAGREAEGWADYGWRWRRPHDLPLPALPEGPRWDGTAIAGGRLLVVDEQGLGDALQFARYLPAAARRVGRVALQC